VEKDLINQVKQLITYIINYNWNPTRTLPENFNFRAEKYSSSLIFQGGKPAGETGNGLKN
jgi:hypothetical protein